MYIFILNCFQNQFNSSTQDFRKYSTSSATGTITPEPPFPSHPNKYIQDSGIYQNHRQSSANYSHPIQSQHTPNFNNQSQITYNNSLAGPPQIGNSYNNQPITQTKTVPPTPPPDSGSRCMTPSSVKPGKI